jgi:hypothetical protein
VTQPGVEQRFGEPDPVGELDEDRLVLQAVAQEHVVDRDRHVQIAFRAR